jgi:hypothetical protein
MPHGAAAAAQEASSPPPTTRRAPCRATEMKADPLARAAGLSSTAPWRSRRLDRGGLVSAATDDAHGLPVGARTRGAPGLCRTHVWVHDRAGLRTATIGPPPLVGRRPGGRAATLSDASLVEDLDALSGQGFTQDPIEIPRVMLDDEDPSAAGRRFVPYLTRRVSPPVVQRAEPAGDRDRAVPVAPGAGHLVRQAVTIQT